MTLYPTSDIGDGWDLSVMDTEEEYDFVRETNKGFKKSDQHGFLIGGSTNSQGVIAYSEYNTIYAPGKNVLKGEIYAER